MAAHRQALLFVAVVFAVASLASAMEWKVGDAGGWRAQFNKTGWADGKTFRVGDTLSTCAMPYLHSRLLERAGISDLGDTCPLVFDSWQGSCTPRTTTR